jgi:hypothetical protein
MDPKAILQMGDDALRKALFERLVKRLDAESSQDQSLTGDKRSPGVYSLSRSDGHRLTVEQGHGARLLRGVIRWGPHDGAPPWTFSVSRSVDRARLAMHPGGAEGSISDVVENIVTTFLDQVST